MRVTYRNAGEAPLTIAVDGFKMTRPTGDAALRTAVEATGVNLADALDDEIDRGRILHALENGGDARATLRLLPGASRDVDAELTSFSNEGAVKAGDRIVATIQMANVTATGTFVATKFRRCTFAASGAPGRGDRRHLAAALPHLGVPTAFLNLE